MSHVVIVGDGIVGLFIAYRLSSELKHSKITIVGRGSKYSGSRAAGAMLNVFAEVDENTFRSNASRLKFEMVKEGAAYWKLMNESGLVRIRRGTKIFHNSFSDDSDNFYLIKKALVNHDEEHAVSSDSQFYGISKDRQPIETVDVHHEGWVDPDSAFNFLITYLKSNSNVTFFEETARSLDVSQKALITTKRSISYDKLVIASGAGPYLYQGIGADTPRIFAEHGCGILVSCPEILVDRDLSSRVTRTPVRAGACGLYLIPRDYKGTFYIGASSEVGLLEHDFKTPSCHPRASTVVGLLKNAAEQIDGRLSRARVLEVISGSRCASEDGLPLAGWLYDDILFYGAGRRDGLTCAPVFAQDALDKIQDTKKEPAVPNCLKPNRKPIVSMSREDGIDQAVKFFSNYDKTHKKRVRSEKTLRKKIERAYDDARLDYGVIPEVLVYNAKTLSSVYAEALFH